MKIFQSILVTKPFSFTKKNFSFISIKLKISILFISSFKKQNLVFLFLKEKSKIYFSFKITSVVLNKRKLNPQEGAFPFFLSENSQYFTSK